VRLRVLVMGAWLLACAAPAAWAQEDGPFGPPRPIGGARTAERPADDGAAGTAGWLDVSLSAGSWFWFSHFRAETATDRFEITGPTTADVRLGIAANVWKQLDIELAPEFALGDGTTTWAVGLGAAMRLDLFEEWGPLLDGRLRTRLGFLVGGFDWDKAPGSFDTGFGAELGAEFACRFDWLPTGLALTAALDLRSMTFKFDPDPDVQDTDSAYGGFGLVVRFGLRYAF
jgi:hypothetical protein